MSKNFDDNENDNYYDDEDIDEQNYKKTLFVGSVEATTYINKKEQTNKVNRVKEVYLNENDPILNFVSGQKTRG